MKLRVQPPKILSVVTLNGHSPVLAALAGSAKRCRLSKGCRQPKSLLVTIGSPDKLYLQGCKRLYFL